MRKSSRLGGAGERGFGPPEMKEVADQGRPLFTDGRSGMPSSPGRAVNRNGTRADVLMRIKLRRRVSDPTCEFVRSKSLLERTDFTLLRLWICCG
jgi:hypothetical protein